MKFRYTYTVEHEVPKSAYPKHVNPLETEIKLARETLDMDLNEGLGNVAVEIINETDSEDGP